MSSAAAIALVVTLPDLQAAEVKLRELGEARGVRYRIANFGSLRSEADTARIIGYRDADYAVYVRQLKEKNPSATPVPKERWRPIAPFGRSMHNYGAAFDVLVISAPPGVNGYAVLGELAPRAGLRWGGTFKTKVDPPHFELPITLEAAQQRWRAHVAGAAKKGASVAGILIAFFFPALAALPIA